MGLDRELRSSKRQRIRSTCSDVSPVNSQLFEQASELEKQEIALESRERSMMDCKSEVVCLTKDAAKGSESDNRKTCLDASEETDRIEKPASLEGIQSDGTNGMIDMYPVKKESHLETNDGSNESFPEHNGKVVDTLLLLKRTNVAVPKPEPCPTSALEETPKAAICGVEHRTRNKKTPAVDIMTTREFRSLLKLKRYIHESGENIGDGWMVDIRTQNKRPNKIYISPENKRFKSMAAVLRHLEALKEKKSFKGIKDNLKSVKVKRSAKGKGKQDNSNDPKVKGGSANPSVWFNANVSHAQQIPENLREVPVENNEKDIFPRISPTVKASRVQQEESVPLVIEHGPRQRCSSSATVLDKSELQPLSGSFKLGIEETHIPGNSRMHERPENTENKQHGHWAEALEEVSKSSNISSSGIRDCILKALACRPPEWAREVLQHAIQKDVSKSSGTEILKEAISSVHAWYCHEESNKQAGLETFKEKLMSSYEKSVQEKGLLVNQPEKEKTAQKACPSSELVTECCRNVFLDITSADKFATLCNLINGSFAGSRTHEGLDFRLIDLRMNAGTYGKSPELFALDLQKMWKNVREVGQEMVLLADALLEHSQQAYQKQVSTLLQGETGESFHFGTTENVSINGGSVDQEVRHRQSHKVIDEHHTSEQNKKPVKVSRTEDVNLPPCSTLKNLQTSEYTGGLIGKLGPHELIDTPKKGSVSPDLEIPALMKNTEHITSENAEILKTMEDAINDCILCEQQSDHLHSEGLDSSVTKGVCRACGVNERDDCILLCDACEAAYHMYCLSPALEEIPSGNWYCSLCTASGKGHSEMDSLDDGKEKMITAQNVENEDHHCVVCKRLRQMEPQINKETVLSDTGKEQAEPNCGRQEVEMPSNREDFEFPSVREGMESCPITDELELHNNGLVKKMCKVCSIGKKDNDDFIECSNTNCAFKFFHLSCLKPPLVSVPSHTWYCPSCLCRACLVDENDDHIILCDGCDDGYHTYCLKRPLATIPKRKWYCPSCRKKQRMRKGNNPGLRTMATMGLIRTAHDIYEGTLHPVSQNSLPRAQANKTSRSVSPSSMVTPELGGELSDESHGFKENFHIRFRSKSAIKSVTDMESKEAGKRKRKCLEPRRSEG